MRFWYTFQILFKEFIFNKIFYRDIPDIQKWNSKIKEKLIKNLSKRGIQWPLKQSDNIHIVYASYPSSWEIINIPDSLLNLTKNVSFYYLNEQDITFKKSRYKGILKNDNTFYQWINLLNQEKKIDIIITYFSGAEISSSTIKKIKNLKIPIFTFHLDDRLHFFGRLIKLKFSGPISVCREYDLNLSSSIFSLNQYNFFRSLVYFWPEGANVNFFKPNSENKFQYDVAFIGSKYGDRQKLINFLLQNGINVECFGHGWENGSITSRQYIDILNTTKIVLGLGYISFTHLQTLKGRDFEVPSAGCVYLTTHNKELELMFDIGKEIITYYNFQDCLNKINYYLNNENELNNIRSNARNAVIARHSWEKRFRQVLFNES